MGNTSWSCVGCLYGVGVPACARVCGWGHAVGFWGGAPWLWPAWPVPPGVGVWVVVGGLVVICIVDASIIDLCSCAACPVIVTWLLGVLCVA